MELHAQTLPIGELCADTAEQMLELMRQYYDGVSASQFHADLRAKQWVILLHDRGRLRGFSTQLAFDHACAGRRVKLLFSGDTIIEKTCWGSLALPVAWGRLMLSLLAANPGMDLYWLLTSKGYKTYRFLPVFFREFFPCHSALTPAFERELLRSVARQRFGTSFESESGILRAPPGGQRLREGVADIDSRRLQDPHVAFFHKMNPGHARGDELVCLARFHPDNLTAYIRRQI
jgi:hypothetical protein